MKLYILSIFLLSHFVIYSQIENLQCSFKANEKLQYSIKYSMYIDVEVAGIILTTENQNIKGKDFWSFTAYSETYNYSDNILKLKTGYQSIADKNTLLPRIYIRSLKHSDKESKKTVLINHKKKIAKNKETQKLITIKNDTRDILSSIYYLRCQNINSAPIGNEFWTSTIFSNKLWQLGFKKVKTENINTIFGQTNCIVLQPILTKKLISELNFFSLTKDNPIIQSANQIKIWFTNDKNKIPVKIESTTEIGSLIIELKKAEGLKYD